MLICPKCQTENQPADRFCQGCGQPLDNSNDPSMLIDTGIVCASCDTFNEPNQKHCTKCGQFLGGLTEILSAFGKAPEEKKPSSMNITLISGFGKPDTVFPLDSLPLSIGRLNTTIEIAADPYLSARHASLEYIDDRLAVKDANSLNGTFLRIRGSIEIAPKTEIIVGHQRILLLGTGNATTDSRLNPPKDTRLYGSPIPKHPYLALRMLHADEDGKSIAGLVMLCSGPVITVGQKDCDLNFPSDTWMAPRHLELHLEDAKIKAVVPADTKGVFIRINEPTFLENADEMLVGEELFRITMP